MTREDLQGIAAHRLAKTGRLICQWATGTGKSGVLLKFLKANPEMDCLILVPEQNNIENWKDEFRKFDVPLDKVTIACYASLHKYKGSRWDVLCFDEAPHVDTVRRKAICQSVYGEYILALGAVIDDDETATLESVYGTFEKSYLSLKRAIELGILPCPSVKILEMTLDNKEKRHYHKGYFLTDQQMYDAICREQKSAKDCYEHNPSVFNKNRMLSVGSKRKRFLGEIKTEAMKKVCDMLTGYNKRFICFCVSIAQANELGGERAYTSKTKASAKVLEKFNNHEIDSIYVVGKLIEGQNLNDIHCGVIGQLGGTSRITVQELGRVFRSKDPVVYVPVFEDSKDDSFLFTLTSNIPEDYIKRYKL